MENTLTDLDTALLSVLSQSKWMSRSEIAIEIGRPSRKLNYYDIARLGILVDAGLIEQQIETIGVAKKQFSYRRKEVK